MPMQCRQAMGVEAFTVHRNGCILVILAGAILQATFFATRCAGAEVRQPGTITELPSTSSSSTSPVAAMQTAEDVQGAYDAFILEQTYHHGASARPTPGHEREHAHSRCSHGECAACALARGTWCVQYHSQVPVAWRPAPRGSRRCPNTTWGECNGVGNCNYDYALCECPAGWAGAACDEPLKRPCTNRRKDPKRDPGLMPTSHIGPDKLDLDLYEPGYSPSRCMGYCDDDRASCWCPPGTKHGRQPAAPGAPPWQRYVMRGRPMTERCKAGKDNDGKQLPWFGDSWMDIDAILGPQGWCNVDDPQLLVHGGKESSCLPKDWGCQEEGLHGPLCNVTSEVVCVNQCTGHGECDAGFCKCHEGWYGHDCSRKRAGLEMEAGDETRSKPYLRAVLVQPPAAAQRSGHEVADGNLAAGASSGGSGARAGGRLRPLIYIYDMPPEFTTRNLQYKRTHDRFSNFRLFTPDNRSHLSWGVLSDLWMETYLHEMLAISPHRTFDPEEADFFYVPVYYCLFAWPNIHWADAPFFGPPDPDARAANIAWMWLTAKRWLQTHLPWWDRRQGRDHIWLTNLDEGACYMPTEIYNTSIMLTHWGRMDPNHISNSAYNPDDYSRPWSWPSLENGRDARDLYRGHPCYDPFKDLVIPVYKAPSKYPASPLLGRQPYVRDILLYFRGEVSVPDVPVHNNTKYSRGVRQKLARLAKEHEWAKNYRVWIGSGKDIQGPYSEHLARSTFCLVPPGSGYSTRMEDAVLHGCIPLVIMDGVHVSFESILDWGAFSLRLREAAVDQHLPRLLAAISPAQVEGMQRNLALVCHRFAYTHGPLHQAEVRRLIAANRAQAEQQQQPARQPQLTASERLHILQGNRSRSSGSSSSSASSSSDPGPGYAAAPSPHHPFQPVSELPARHDALATILQWLHSRIPHTRAPGESPDLE